MLIACQVNGSIQVGALNERAHSELVKGTLRRGCEGNFLLKLISGQGPSLKNQRFIASEPSNCNSEPLKLLELKLSSTASFSISLLLLLSPPSLLLQRCCQEWFAFFHQFPFLLKLVTFIYFLLLFCGRNSGRCCQIASFSATLCDVCLCARVKMRKGLEWFPYLTNWKWMQRERVAIHRLLNKVHWLPALINNRREALFQASLQGSCLVEDSESCSQNKDCRLSLWHKILARQITIRNLIVLITYSTSY